MKKAPNFKELGARAPCLLSQQLSRLFYWVSASCSVQAHPDRTAAFSAV